MVQKRAVVLLSGGLDSATTLASAIKSGYQCDTLSFYYGQTHASELAAAYQLSEEIGARNHKTIELPLDEIGGSSLTDKKMVIPKKMSQEIPNTYVPARNTIFLSYALAWGEVHEIFDIFIGINMLDYSGYPDCRLEYIKAFEKMANLGTKSGLEQSSFQIHVPLIELNKAQIILLGLQLGVDFSLTISCYQADIDGKACGYCESCQFRRIGFEQAGVADPTRYQ